MNVSFSPEELYNSSMNTKAFWTSTLERTIRTMAQTALGILGTSAVGVLDADWQAVASASAMAGVLTILFCIAGNATAGSGPSFSSAEVLKPKTDG